MASQGISLAVLGKECICRAQLVEAAVADLPSNSIQKERLFKCAKKEHQRPCLPPSPLPLVSEVCS